MYSFIILQNCKIEVAKIFLKINVLIKPDYCVNVEPLACAGYGRRTSVEITELANEEKLTSVGRTAQPRTAA